MTNKEYPLITIGIPTYNRADNYLKQSLGSALNQTYSNIEIVVSDNCSSDNTEELVRSYNDPRIRYFRQSKNIGRVGNSNFCLEQARGDYFQQLQDDDFIENEFVETCMKAADYSTDFGMIQTGTRVIDADGRILQECPNGLKGKSIEEYVRGWFAFRVSFYLCSTLFHTKRLREIGGFRSKRFLFDDVVAMVQLAAKYDRIDIKDIKASFRKHSGETTFAAKVKDWSEDSLYLLDLICSLVPEGSRNIVRQEGLQMLSLLNYNFAGAIQSPCARIMAFIEVYRMFDYKRLPPSFEKLIIYLNPVYYLKVIFAQRKKI